MELIIVKPAELRTHWPVISQALGKVIDATAPDWIPEDVYHRLKVGSALCHLIYGLGKYQAMFIVTEEVEEYSGNRSIHIWIAQNDGGNESYEFGLDNIKAIAAHAGASRLTIESPRHGWAKRFKLVSATYEVPIQ